MPALASFDGTYERVGTGPPVSFSSTASPRTARRTGRFRRDFRVFAARTGADLRALAAIERVRARPSPVRFDAITMPALVLAGREDALIRPPDELAARLPRARLELVPGDHLTAVARPAFRAAILAFLAAVDRGEA